MVVTDDNKVHFVGRDLVYLGYYFATDDKNFIFFDAKGHYFASKEIVKNIYFLKEGKLFSFDQFDVYFNRPDLLIRSINPSDTVRFKIFNELHKKRFKKAGLIENSGSIKFEAPTIQVSRIEKMDYLVVPQICFIVNANSESSKLKTLVVSINGVPIIKMDCYDNILFDKNINLELSIGLNKIEFFVLNSLGIESLKESFFITYTPKMVTKPNLYLINIGDSKYKDNRFDLTYASKDAEDIKSTFEKNSNYANVFTYVYTNEQVTKENILQLKEELKKAKRDDVVIITVAGHGVLDKDLNYYLATYDMDFNNPAEKGLPYEDLESLVDGIAPLKKVLFLDACHSGEVDKEEVEQLAMNTTTEGDVKFRAAGAGIQKKNLGLKTTSELMGELFTDLRRGTGATVISSAGGAEYAMESAEWKNGLFTYCLLHGLKDMAADANNDGQIMLSELQQYLRTEVTKLSKGAQQPTSRIENLSMDFRIW